MTIEDDGRLSVHDAARLAQRARAFEHLFDAVVVTDLDGVVIDWNPGAEALYGYAREEILGQPVSVLHVGEDVERITAEVFAGIARDGFWTGEIKRRGRDGTVGWIESMVIPLLDAAGAPAGALGVNRDITARKQAEEALRLSETRWRGLMESLPDAVLICDRGGAIVAVNARAEALLGYTRDELVGQPIELVVPDEHRDAHVAHRVGYVAAPHPRAMGDGRTLSARRRDGSLVPVEIGLGAIETPAGPWVMAVVHDVGAREAMTERLRLLGAALEAAANGVAISDTRGVCQWINPGFTAITGYGPDEMIGHRFSRLSSGAHDEAFFRALWETISAGRPWQGEIVNRHRDGHTYVEEQTITPVRDVRGAITHYIAIKQDITRRRQMEEQLQAANATLTRQLAEIEALQAALREQAVCDPLTGLYNRRYLAEALDRELSRARRGGDPIAVVIIDLDNFKSINDSRGHRAGDHVLATLGGLLRAATRRSDIACRYGGEEFTILMPGATAEVAMARAESLRSQVLATEFLHEGRPIRISLSAGVSAFPLHGTSGDELLRAADDALYGAKRAGRDRVVLALQPST